MKSFFEYRREREQQSRTKFCNEYPEDIADLWFQGLFTDGPEQKVIINWCKKAAPIRNRDHFEKSFYYPSVNLWEGECCAPEEWEIRLWWLERTLIFAICDRHLDPWDAASTAERRRVVSRAVKTARELADLLQNSALPVTAIMRDRNPILDAWAQQEAMPEDDRELSFLTTDYLRKLDEIRSGMTGKLPPAVNMSYLELFRDFSDSAGQIFPEILRSLADTIESLDVNHRHDARPNTGDAGARIIARKLAQWFSTNFEIDNPPNAVIAACITLLYPDMDPPPNEDTIRDWRDVK